MLSHMTYVNQSEATLENYSGTVKHLHWDRSDRELSMRMTAVVQMRVLQLDSHRLNPWLTS